MKIATYFKSKGDTVTLYKGLMTTTKVQGFDKVLITTLFTFDFDITIQTIRYYIAILGVEKIFVGGIAATIMPENFRDAIPGIKLIERQLVSSKLLGYNDNINIDALELDYDILWDIEYRYPAEDSYFIYASRGCPRKCPFCAVRILEPTFYNSNNIEQQIQNIDAAYGIKKNLLVMDNNILYSKQFEKTVETFETIGFGRNNNRIKKNNPVKYYLKSLRKRVTDNRDYSALLKRISNEIENIKLARVRSLDKNLVGALQKLTPIREDKVPFLLAHEIEISSFFDRYHNAKITRHVDFNQGLDARLFDENKARLLGKLAIKPCRIAFDDLKLKEEYFKAMNLALKYGLKSFSNYILYNFKDRPEELWERLYLNISFCKKNAEKKMNLFSFPMKYASIKHTNRDYVGNYWNKKFLCAINVILNVTSGVVAKEEGFFERAYGKTAQEFIEILTMPDDFIRYRTYFEDLGLTELWRKCYLKLTQEEVRQLIDVLEHLTSNPELLDASYSPSIDQVLKFYKLRKKKIEKNRLYYENLIGKWLQDTNN